MKYIQFNEASELLGRYDSDIHGENVPADAVEISDALFFQTINETDGVWKREPVTGDIEKHPLPSVPPYVPQQVTRRQGQLALLDADRLDAVEAALEAITDPTEKRIAQIEFGTDTWERGNAFLQGMWAQLGGTEAELDALFVAASSK